MNKIIKGVFLAAVMCIAATGCDKLEELAGMKSDPLPAKNLVAEKETAKELVKWVKAFGKETDMQHEEAFKKLKGKTVVFKGTVRDVGKTMIEETPYVSLKVGKIDMLQDLNIQFNFGKKDIATIGKWNKGETHAIRGRIAEIGDLEDDAKCEAAESVSVEEYDAAK
ncbi:MAG: hypothetical protein K6F50_00860 [Kiritimatiellae bacterium]|nr:hypothetical protein [Kiritimatiellia bacterium]